MASYTVLIDQGDTETEVTVDNVGHVHSQHGTAVFNTAEREFHNAPLLIVGTSSLVYAERTDGE